MSCILPNTTNKITDLRDVGVNASGVYTVKIPTANGPVTRNVSMTPEQRQKQYINEIVARTKRSVNKYITAMFTATGNATALLGDAFLATGLADANGTWAFQNGASSAADQKTAFNRMIIGQPFKYIGIQIDASASSLFSGLTWREYITDYDSTNNYDWKPKVNAALDTYAQIATTRFLRVGGEFNGNWALYITGLVNTNTLNFTFNCVDIDRNW